MIVHNIAFIPDRTTAGCFLHFPLLPASIAKLMPASAHTWGKRFLWQKQQHRNASTCRLWIITKNMN